MCVSMGGEICMRVLRDGVTDIIPTRVVLEGCCSGLSWPLTTMLLVSEKVKEKQSLCSQLGTRIRTFLLWITFSFWSRETQAYSLGKTENVHFQTSSPYSRVTVWFNDGETVNDVNLSFFHIDWILLVFNHILSDLWVNITVFNMVKQNLTKENSVQSPVKQADVPNRPAHGECKTLASYWKRKRRCELVGLLHYRWDFFSAKLTLQLGWGNNEKVLEYWRESLDLGCLPSDVVWGTKTNKTIGDVK